MTDPLFLGISTDTWRFINTFAPWLSALGTVAAVIVSLWLAISRGRPKVRVSAGHRLLLGVGDKPPFPEFVNVRVVNVGDKMVRITGIGWRVGTARWGKQGVQLIDGSVAGNSRIPIELEHGQEAQWFIPFGLPESWQSAFAQKFLLPHWRLNLWTTRVWASTSVGITFQAKMENSLRKKLAEECRRNSGNDDKPPTA